MGRIAVCVSGMQAFNESMLDPGKRVQDLPVQACVFYCVNKGCSLGYWALDCNGVQWRSWREVAEAEKIPKSVGLRFQLP